jgi:hypothetical protein
VNLKNGTLGCVVVLSAVTGWYCEHCHESAVSIKAGDLYTKPRFVEQGPSCI